MPTSVRRFFRKHDSVDLFLIALIAVVLAASVSLLLFMIFVTVDSRTTEEFIEQREVAGRIHTEGHFQSQVINAGKVTTISQIWIPDSWSITINNNGNVLKCPVSEFQYNTIEDEEVVEVTMSEGRLTDLPYCLGVQ